MSGEGGRRTGGVGEGLRPPSLFVLVVRWCVVLGAGGGKEFDSCSHLSIAQHRLPIIVF